MDDASPEVLESIEVAPNIHDGLARYTITPDGGKLMMGRLILQQTASANVLYFIPHCQLSHRTTLILDEEPCRSGQLPSTHHNQPWLQSQ